MANFLRACAVVMLAIMAASVLLSGCTTTPATTGAPTITISSPQDGATVPAGNVTVTVQVTNFSIVDKQGQASVPGEGHLHFYMDVSPLPNDPVKPAIPANASAVWAHVSGTTYTFTNVSAGTHTISAQLANNDHTPVSPIVTDSVTVTATGSSATEQPTTESTATSTTIISTTTTRSSGGSSGY